MLGPGRLARSGLTVGAVKDMLLRVGAYIDNQERVTCETWCGVSDLAATWRTCPSEVHAEGRALLVLVGGDPEDEGRARLASIPDTGAAPGAQA